MCFKKKKIVLMKLNKLSDVILYVVTVLYYYTSYCANDRCTLHKYDCNLIGITSHIGTIN